MKKESPKKRINVNAFFQNLLFLFTLIFILLACSNNSPKDNELSNAKVKTDKIPLIVSDEYSKMKDGQKVYQIKSSDSLIVDISNYEFILPDPAFTYIRENIDYPEMLGGSWAYIDILYDDSSEIRGTIVEMEKEGILHIDKVMETLKEKKIKDFIIAFRFNIDNGKGQQEIDHFPVHIVN